MLEAKIGTVVNVDESHAPFWSRGMTLTQFLTELGVNPQALEDAKASYMERLKLSNNVSKMVHRFCGFGSKSTKEQEFFHEGKDKIISIATHYQTQYGIELENTDAICVRISDKFDSVPIELLEVKQNEKYANKQSFIRAECRNDSSCFSETQDQSKELEGNNASHTVSNRYRPPFSFILRSG